MEFVVKAATLVCDAIVHPTDGAGDSQEKVLTTHSSCIRKGGICVCRSRMTIQYRKHAVSTRTTRTRTKLLLANGTAEDDSTAEFNEHKEVCITNREAALDMPSHTLLENMIAEASATDEQKAREVTLGILTLFAKIRRIAQEGDQNPSPPTNKSKLAAEAKLAAQAGKKMMSLKRYRVFNDVGAVPGVRVGDWCSYTQELLLIGLHKHLRSNICHLPSTSEAARTKYNNRSVVCSILASETDRINGDKLLFMGQGGKQKQSRAETGNLALMNSCNLGLPVRVIRREKDSGSVSGRRFTYYGLYKVTRYFLDAGPYGFPIYKFFLQREGNQLSLESILHSTRPDPSAALPGAVLTPDISGGMERTPVRVVNAIDMNAPEPFHYVTTVVYLDAAQVPVQTQACECVYSCTQDGVCACVKRNSGGVSAYNDDGHLIRVRNIVYECGPACKCSAAACKNRVSQKGLRYRLEVFRTMSKGWGVRTLDFIPSGSFVCELTGELLTAAAAAERENDEYLFNLDFHANARSRNKPQGSSKCGKGKVVPMTAIEVAKAVHYVVDCRLKGNVARFINHSCDPNLFVQGVLHDHGDLNRGHITLFAGEDIPPRSELSYDYAYELDSVQDAYGTVVAKECHCGARFCKKRMY